MELSRAEKVIIYVIGTCEELKKKGLLAGGNVGLGKEGQKTFEQLKACDFKPTPEEMTSTLAYIQSGMLNKAMTE